jgi:gamma-glutamyl:cysteine ligase YbdK (ATP-grasp superfamily)
MDHDPARLRLFGGYGVELEYMIVDRDSLDVRPIADEILRVAAGEACSDFENGAIAWSNELALHVLEIKTNGPAARLAELPARFQENVSRINAIAGQWNAQLMPTAMHPWMDPHRELKIWPHEYNPVYEAYNRIFDCRGHGWANLQSTHINLPFADDREFERLHAAIRLLLPLIPAIAASSPVADGRLSGFVDYRMEVYRHNSAKIPSIAGRVIPEAVFSEADYNRLIFQKIWADIAPWDPEGTLQHPFLNSRGAIARFERGAIEIRVVDIQECVAADIAIVEWLVATLKLMTEEAFLPLKEQKQIGMEPLATLFLDAIRDGEQAEISDSDLLRAYGIAGNRAKVGQVWQEIFERLMTGSPHNLISPAAQPVIRTILDKGSLSRRITRALDGDLGRLHGVYGELCQCLQLNCLFT